jgi:hypothetical protein
MRRRLLTVQRRNLREINTLNLPRELPATCVIKLVPKPEQVLLAMRLKQGAKTFATGC